MNQNKFILKSENLVVDYISFKFQHLDNFTQKEITNYLFKLGFNSYQESGKLAKPIKEPIQVNFKNQFEVLFVQKAPYWQCTTLHFFGFNATRFYFFSKEQLIDWRVFSSGIFNRVDLYYSRTNKTDDKISVREFFENCHKQLTQTNKNLSFDKNSKGLILKIGNRKSNYYFRIYQSQKKDSLKFEFEMKGRFLKKYHTLLVSNRLEEFEQKLSSQFLLSFGKLLPLNYSYLDWLIIKLRPMRKQIILQAGSPLKAIIH